MMAAFLALCLAAPLEENVALGGLLIKEQNLDPNEVARFYYSSGGGVLYVASASKYKVTVGAGCEDASDKGDSCSWFEATPTKAGIIAIGNAHERGFIAVTSSGFVADAFRFTATYLSPDDSANGCSNILIYGVNTEGSIPVNKAQMLCVVAAGVTQTLSARGTLPAASAVDRYGTGGAALTRYATAGYTSALPDSYKYNAFRGMFASSAGGNWYCTASAPNNGIVVQVFVSGATPDPVFYNGSASAYAALTRTGVVPEAPRKTGTRTPSGGNDSPGGNDPAGGDDESGGKPDDKNNDDSGGNTGVVAGGVVGGLLGTGTLAGVVTWILKAKDMLPCFKGDDEDDEGGRQTINKVSTENSGGTGPQTAVAGSGNTINQNNYYYNIPGLTPMASSAGREQGVEEAKV
jgi:hypothetical protein